MKKVLFTLLTIMSLSVGCEKEIIQPKSIVANEPTTIEKAQTKRKLYCNWLASDGVTIIAHGTKCVSTGDECGRGSYCTATLGSNQNPKSLVFPDMTLDEFIDFTKTQEGVNYLYSRGVRDVEVDEKQ